MTAPSSTPPNERPPLPPPGGPGRPGPEEPAPVRGTGWPRLAGFAPNWFAVAMGTGIVANAAATLPVQPPGLLVAARVVWVLDVLLLVILAASAVLHVRHHRGVALAHLHDPVRSQFYGAVPMALLTVGAGALLVGIPVVGETTAIAVDAVLWTLGTVLGLVTTVLVPYRMFTTHRVGPDAAFGGWLMPVVPPMVSAATGPLLAPHLPAGQPRLTLLLACAAMFGMALIASVVVIGLLWGRLAQHQVGTAAAVPTLWIVLGPLGQSVTAAHTIGTLGPTVLPAPYGVALEAAGVVYGVPVWGFGVLWLALVVALTVRTARAGMPFTMTWWSFTFPVGTMVTGTSALASSTGADVLEVLAVLGYVVLVAAWAVVATRTLSGLASGRLLPA